MTTPTRANAKANGRLQRMRKLLNGAAGAALVITSVAASAQQAVPLIVVDPAGAGPGATKLDIAANATPIIKIATPNEGGTSHNKYSAFNVDARGLILNNSATITTTQLAGYIDGNANLKKTGPALLILNEVTGASASQLNGYLEVAGTPAQVVVANANGITCGGCGFINTPWATLTTGAPTIGADGKLSGFAVERGVIDVGGTGLDASGMRLDLFARAVRLNAGLYADSINVVAGAGDVSRGETADGTITVTARTGTGDAPVRFALDVAALGGMYARSIRLIGTEAGLGVNVDGTLASLERSFDLTSAGEVVLGGKAVAATTATIRAGGDATVAGTVYGGGNTTIVSGGIFMNSGLSASGTDLIVQARGIVSPGTLVAGFNRDGSLAATGNLSLASSGTVQIAGQTIAPGALTLTAGTLDLRSAAIQGASATLSADRIVQAAKSQLVTSGTLAITARSGLTNAGVFQGGAVTLSGSALVNDGGQIVSTGALDFGLSGSLSNAGGLIQSGGVTTVAAGSIANGGGSLVNISAAKTSITTAGGIASRSGTIGGNGAITVRAASIDVGSGRLLAGGALDATATAGEIAADAGVISAGASLNLTAASGSVRAQSGGQIVARGAGVLNAGAIDTTGGLLSADTLAITTGRLVNAGGTISANGAGASSVAATSVDNSAGIIHADGGTLTLASGAIANAGGRIEHAGSGMLTVGGATSIANADGTIATNGNLTLTTQTLANARGVISAGGAATLGVSGTLGNQGGNIDAGGALAVRAGSVDNAGGAIIATGTGALTVVSDGIIASRAGTIGGNGDVTVSATAIDVGGVGQLARPGQAGGNGQLSAGGALIANASAGDLLFDNGGLISAGKTAALTASGGIRGAGGTILAGATAALKAGSITLDGGALQAAGFTLDAANVSLRRTRLVQTGTADLTLTTPGTLDYSGTDFTSNGVNFTLQAGSIVNQGGALRHAGGGVFSLTANSLVNRDGLIATAGTLAIKADSLDNSGGLLSAAGDAGIIVANGLANGAGGSKDSAGGAIAGAIVVGGALTLRAGAVTNAGGDIEAAGAVNATLASLTGPGGQFKSTGTNGGVTLVATGLVEARGGLIGSNGATSVRAGSIDVGAKGQLIAGTTLDATAAGTLRADGGAIGGRTIKIGAANLVTDGGALAGDTLALTLGALSNVGGTISAIGTNASSIAVSGTLANTGTLQANSGTLTIGAGTLENSGDGIRHYGPGQLVISAGRLVNSGAITTNAALALNGATLINSGAIGAVGAARVTATSSLANAGTLATGADLTLSGGAVTNTGALSGTTGVTAGLTSYDGGGGRLLAGRFDVAGDASALTLTTTGAASARGGTIAATGATTIKAGSVDVGSGGVLAGRTIGATASKGDIAAIGGTIQAGTGQAGTGQGQAFVPGALTLRASGAVDASGNGVINGGAVTLDAASLRTGSGGTLAAATLTATLGAVDNVGGTIAVTGGAPLTLTVAGTFGNGAGGRFQTNASDLSLLAGRFDNAGGTILHAGTGTLALNATGAVDNGGGTIATGGRYAITAASLANDGRGSITAPGASSIRIGGALANRGGAILADAGLTVGAGAVTNSGTIGSSQGALALAATSLANMGGRVQASGLNLSTGTGAVDNAGGLIGSSGALTLAAGALGNAKGTIHGDGDTVLTLASLANGGELSAARALSVTVGGLADNAGGSLLGTSVAIVADRLTNGGGLISGAQTARVQTAGLLDNDAGAIGSGRQLTLVAGSLINGGTISSATQGAADLASNAMITVTGVTDTREGSAIWADRDLVLTSGSLVNAGSIAAGNAAAINAASIDNSAATGILGGGNSLALTFGSATLGKLALGRDFSLTTNGDWANAAGQAIEAPRDLTLNVAGVLTNAGTIAANRAATVASSGDLTNQAGGTIKADRVSVTAGGTLTNAGLINGGSLALVNAGSLVNTGQIFGDAVTVAATGDVTNSGATGVIATRAGTLALLTPGSVNNINDALLYSSGDLVIARRDGDGFGRAASILNSSALIEAQGNGLLSAETITNTRTVFEFAPVETSSTYVKLPFYFPNPRDRDHRTSERFTRTILDTRVTGDSGEAQLLIGGGLLVNAGTLNNLHSTISAIGDLRIDAGTINNIALAKTETQNENGVFYQEKYVCVSRVVVCFDHDYRFDRTTPLSRSYIAQLGTLTPSVIAAGGDLTIIAGTVNNLLLDANGDTVSASETLGGRTAALGATGAAAFSADASANSTSAVTVAAGRQSVLGAAGSAAGVSGTGAGVTNATITGVAGIAASGSALARPAGTITARSASQVSVLGGETGFAVVSGMPLPVGAGGAAPALGQVIGLPTAATAAFKISIGGLFSFAPSGARYLIETNPAFTGQSNFLSSDYFLGRLGYDPTRVQQRLGDALYEQQLIGQQLTSLTGTMRLAGYANNDDQYRALMDSGVEYAKRFDLALGVGLSAEQMASLTTDIILLVDVTVQTPSGPQHALAPVVYLTSLHTGDLQNSGALIASGGTMNVRTSGALTNTGVIRAVAGSSIAAGTTLTNGGVIAGGQVTTIGAGGDLVSNGGRFSGGDVTLAAGGNMVLGTTAATSHTVTSYAKSGSLTDATVHNVTTVDASGKLLVIARGDLTTQGAQLTAGDTATVLVGGTAKLGAINDSTTSFAWSPIAHGATSTLATTQSVRGTGVFGENGVTVAAGLNDAAGKLVVNAGTISSATGAVALSGTGGVDIGTATAHDTSSTNSFTRRSGFLSSTTTTATDKITSDTAIGSTIAGDSVAITSGRGGIAITGSNVVADHDVVIAAAGPIAIGAAQSTAREETTSTYKKSGISLGGGGLFIGVAKTANNGTVDSVTNTGSLVGSSGGDVTIASGQALSVTGSTITAPGTVALSGQSIAIANATDTADTTSASKSSSFGITLGMSNPLIDGARTVAQMGSIAATTSNARVAAVAGAAGALSVKNTVDAIGRDTKALGGVNLSASIGFSSSRSAGATHDETVVASQIDGGNVALTARGAGAASTIAVTGSDVRATGDRAAGLGDLTIAADGPITFAAATETSTRSGTSKSTGASIGVSIGIGSPGKNGNSAKGFGAPTVTASFNSSSGSYAGTDVANRESNLSATGTARVTTPGALTIDGSTLGGYRVLVDAGSLSVMSRQDTSTYTERNKSTGLQLSYTFGGSFSGAANFGSGKGDGSFASVVEQAGIYAGNGGYAIDVKGATDVKGAVIASTADASLNRLNTGTLTVAEIRNAESYRASQVDLGIGLGGNLSKTANGKINTRGDGTPLPGIHTSVGTLSATPPVAMSASGSQASVTSSAISPGAITIISGDAASLAAASSVSRDTSTANAGALTQAYTDAKRAEIGQGFEATRQLVGEVGTFLVNRARDADTKKEEADKITAKADKARAAGDMAGAAQLDRQAAALQLEAVGIESKYGPGGTYRQVLTALTAAAGGNVTGSLSSLVKDAAVNVLQQKGSALIGDLVKNNTISSTQATLLHALTGCAAGAASSTASCGTNAAGEGGAAIINALLTRTGATGEPLTSEEAEARTALVQTIVAAIGEAASVDGSELAGAIASAQAETDNNYLGRRQMLAQARELAECQGGTVCKLEVYARYSAISFAQDGAIVAGIPLGAGQQVIADVQGLIELIKDPKAAYDAVKALATDAEVRKQLGAAVLADIDAKLSVFKRATEYGGLENSVAAGKVIGSVAITLAGAATGAYGAAKAATKIATVGIKLAKDGAEAAEAVLASRRAVAAAREAADAARTKAIREGDTIAARADNEAGVVGPISTAKPGQSVVPRNLPEQVLWNQVQARPDLGTPLPLARDPRFPQSGGWQKMQMTTKTTNGSVTIHYQYNAARGIVLDRKITTPPPVQK